MTTYSIPGMQPDGKPTDGELARRTAALVWAALNEGFQGTNLDMPGLFDRVSLFNEQLPFKGRRPFTHEDEEGFEWKEFYADTKLDPGPDNDHNHQ